MSTQTRTKVISFLSAVLLAGLSVSAFPAGALAAGNQRTSAVRSLPVATAHVGRIRVAPRDTRSRHFMSKTHSSLTPGEVLSTWLARVTMTQLPRLGRSHRATNGSHYWSVNGMNETREPRLATGIPVSTVLKPAVRKGVFNCAANSGKWVGLSAGVNTDINAFYDGSTNPTGPTVARLLITH